MSSDVVTSVINVWITQYLAVFCLLSILAWGVGSYLFVEKWQRPVHDSAVYLSVVGVLAGVLVLRPVNADFVLWAPITWFSFTMLMVMELLWIAYLLNALGSSITSMQSRIMRQEQR